jgi:hypothetical protein
MTIEEYVESISLQVVQAASQEEVVSILNDASTALREAHYSKVAQKNFWAAVSGRVRQLTPMLKSQSAAAFNDLVADAVRMIEQLYMRCSE